LKRITNPPLRQEFSDPRAKLAIAVRESQRVTWFAHEALGQNIEGTLELPQAR
jgi:hypothetical protein